MSDIDISIVTSEGIHEPSWNNFKLKMQSTSTIYDVYDKFQEFFCSGYHAHTVRFALPDSKRILNSNIVIDTLTNTNKLNLYAYKTFTEYKPPSYDEEDFMNYRFKLHSVLFILFSLLFIISTFVRK